MIKRDGAYVSYDTILAERDRYRKALDEIMAMFEKDEVFDLVDVLRVVEEALK